MNTWTVYASEAAEIIANKARYLYPTEKSYYPELK